MIGLDRLRRYLETDLGARPENPVLGDLERRLRSIGRSLGRADLDALADEVVARPGPVRERALAELTIGETWLFRDPEQLALLAERALRRGGAPLAIWSAGCATGEEVFTLAHLAAQANPGPALVVGSDVNPERLEQARRGRLSPGAARRRALPPDFAREEDGALVVAAARGVKTAFVEHNLARDPAPPPGRFDVIVCRNVLLYLSAAAVQTAFQTFARALVPDGWLALGPSDVIDRPGQVPPEFRREPGATNLLRRGAAPVDVAPAPVAPPAPRGPAPEPPPPRDEASDRAERLTRMARSRLVAGDAAGAERACVESLDALPGHLPAALLLARMALARGEPTLAVMILEGLRAGRSDEPELNAALAQARAAQGRAR